MRVIVAFFLALYPTFALAVECGPQFSDKRIENLMEGISKSTARLRQHGEQLTEEMARTQGGVSFDRLALESDRLHVLVGAAQEIEGRLQTAWLLALIRGQMVDSRDRMTVNKFLSLSLARTDSNRVSQSMTTTLGRMTRAGIAVDAAAARDAVEKVAGTLASCTVPSIPGR